MTHALRYWDKAIPLAPTGGPSNSQSLGYKRVRIVGVGHHGGGCNVQAVKASILFTFADAAARHNSTRSIAWLLPSPPLPTNQQRVDQQIAINSLVCPL